VARVLVSHVIPSGLSQSPELVGLGRFEERRFLGGVVETDIGGGREYANAFVDRVQFQKDLGGKKKYVFHMVFQTHIGNWEGTSDSREIHRAGAGGRPLLGGKGGGNSKKILA